MITTIYWIIISAIVGFGAFYVFNFFQQKKKTEFQASVLLEKIKKVCKLISVEGEFQEIIDSSEEKKVFLNLITSRKKSLLVVKGKAHVGFDLRKISIQADKDKKLITIGQLPEPEIIALETDIRYYDIQSNILNRYREEDLNVLQDKAKVLMKQKVENSKLPIVAKNQGIEVISLLKTTTELIGWQLKVENSIPEIDKDDTLFVEDKE
jgi:hypothetical protein